MPDQNHMMLCVERGHDFKSAQQGISNSDWNSRAHRGGLVIRRKYVSDTEGRKRQ